MAGSTPIYHLPYPTNTDPIYQGAAQMQSLATAVESVLQANSFTPGAGPVPSASVARSTAQSIPNAADTQVTFTLTEWDTAPGGQAMASANGITIRVTGLYLIEAVFPWAASATGNRAAKINAPAGHILADCFTANSWDNINSVSGQKVLTAGTLLKLFTTQSSGAALNGGATMWADVRARLTATYLRPAP